MAVWPWRFGGGRGGGGGAGGSGGGVGGGGGGGGGLAAVAVVVVVVVLVVVRSLASRIHRIQTPPSLKSVLQVFFCVLETTVAKKATQIRGYRAIRCSDRSAGPFGFRARCTGASLELFQACLPRMFAQGIVFNP